MISSIIVHHPARVFVVNLAKMAETGAPLRNVFHVLCVNGGSYAMCDIAHQCSSGQQIYKQSFKLTFQRIVEKLQFSNLSGEAMVTPFQGEGNF